jgi:hypothetical protein
MRWGQKDQVIFSLFLGTTGYGSTLRNTSVNAQRDWSSSTDGSLSFYQYWAEIEYSLGHGGQLYMIDQNMIQNQFSCSKWVIFLVSDNWGFVLTAGDDLHPWKDRASNEGNSTHLWITANSGKNFQKVTERTSSSNKFLQVPHYHGCSLVEVHIFTNHGRMCWCCSTFFSCWKVYPPDSCTNAHVNTTIPAGQVS